MAVLINRCGRSVFTFLKGPFRPPMKDHMRLFGVHNDGKFNEYIQTPFQVEHEEAVLEGWLEANPDGIVEDGKLLIIRRQVVTKLGGFIDLVAIDRQGAVVVMELKRNRTPRDTLPQASSMPPSQRAWNTEQLENILRAYLNDESLNLSEHHRQYFDSALTRQSLLTRTSGS